MNHNILLKTKYNKKGVATYNVNYNASSIFKYIFMILFIASFVRTLLSGSESTFSFSALLQSISTAPNIPIDWLRSFSDMRITEDWTELFNWLRDFINNFIMPVITLVLFVCVGLAQLIVFFVWVIGILFGIT